MAAKKITAKPLSSFDDLDAAGIGVGYQPFAADAVAPMEAPAEPERTWGAVAKDVGVSALKGAIAVPESIVGMANLVSGGRAGKALEDVGFRPGEAKSILDEQYSDKQKQAFQSVSQAEGFTGKMGAALANPSVIGHTLVESAPLMGMGGVIGRGVMAAAPRVSGVIAGAIGEGAVGAGSSAEAIRQASQDGTLTGKQAALAGASGALTGAFTLLGGKVAQKLGIADVDTMLAGAATNPAVRKGVVRSALEGAVAEGVLEELPQSVQEQVLQNAALGKPLDEGVDQAAVMGLLSGMAMGGGANAVSSFAKPPAQEAADQIRATEKLPESGALTKALNAGVEAKAQAVEAGAPVDGQIAPSPAPDPVDDPVRDQILALPDGARQDALRAYAVVNRTDVAKGVLQYNRKLLDRLLAENAPPPVLGERLTDTDMGSMLGGGGMTGRADPLAGALGMNREAQANSISNVARAAENRPPMPASDAARMLDEARNQGVELAVAEHPAGGFVLVPPQWVTPDMAAQGEARLNETIARMQQADGAPVERAPRTSTAPVDLSLPTDPAQNYVGNLRTVNTPAAQAFVRDFDAGRITPADVRQRMQAEQGVTPDQRLQRAASEAPAQADPVAERLRQAVSQSATSAPTDILNPSGLPFKTKMAADLAAKKSPGAVVPVEGGFVVRPQEPVNVQDVPQAPEVPQAAPAVSPPGQAPQAVGAQPAGPAAGVPAEGAGAVEAAGVAPNSGVAAPNSGVAAPNSGVAAPESQAQAATKGVANQPITRAQVDSAVQQASSAVGARIDAMSAREVQKIAARFLPTMGVAVPAGKARIKATVTDFAKVNPMAAADEFGVTLPADVRRALEAEMQGRVADAGQDDGAPRLADAQQDESNKSVPDKGISDSGGVPIESFSNMLERLAIIPESFGNMDVKTQREMVSSVIAAIGDLKVRQAIVRLVPVDVMNDLTGKQGASKVFLNNPSVLADPLSKAQAKFSVTTARFFDALRIAPANIRAEVLDGLRKTGRRNAELGTTVVAADENLWGKAASVASNGTKVGLPDGGPISLDKELSIAGGAIPADLDGIGNVPARSGAKISIGQDFGGDFGKTGSANFALDDGHNAIPPDNKKIISDFGEKIGGARKDRWKERGLNLDDLDAMTEAEGAELATKANVWKPDYEALSKASEPVTAAMVKTIYDQLAAKPKKNTPEGRRQYVQMMRIVRDVLTEAKGPDAVRNAYLEIRKRAGLNTMEQQAKTAARELLFSVYKGRSDPFVMNGADLMKVKKMVEDGFPAKGEPWKTRLTVGRREGGNGTTERGIEMYMELSAEVGTPLTREQIEAGFFRVQDKKNQTVAFAATKEDAEAAAATVYERDMKGKKDGKPEPVRPNLDELKRENLPKRIDRDVTSEDFVRDLGFRGVEFGLWSAQDERQRILNMAYDGLMDLAEIMGVPPKAMSLNGTLGMAFGARGGGRFAAHYEPGKLVINMTKIRGGGSMAHEWAHAMDHYFGELDKPDAYTTQARGASGWYSEDQYLGVPRKRMERVGNEWKSVEKMRLDNLRPEMAAAFDEVMRALFSKQITKAEMVRSHELDLERTEALARNETQADLKAMYQNMAQNKRQALNELRGDPEGTMYAGRGRSDYASQAQALSGKSENGYWTRPTEMFARAFEGWVFDRVTAMGARSDYLVHGVEEDRFAGGAYKGNPYPAGEERARINAAFDKLASTIQTKETDKGVAMFSRTPATQSNYEARIDALFAGEKAAGPNQGARVLDRSDVLGLMGLGDGPVNLAEGKVIKGQTNHPRMTAEQWKKVPVWLDNPAAVFDSDTVPGALVLIAPETINGATVRMTVEPRKGGGADVHILSNTYDAPGFTPFARWFREGLGRLVDQKKFPAVLSDSGLQLSSSTWQNKPGMPKILTEKHLDGYRRANTPAAFMGQAATTADSNARNVATQLLVDGLKAKWSRAPEIIVARNMQDTQIPQAVRDYDQTLKSQGATGEARGFIYKGKVYLLSDQLKGPQQIAEVLFHEVLGHYGLRGAFGDALTPILKQIAALRRADVQAKAKEYGLDMSKEADRLQAAEEVLAEMAQSTPELGYVQRAIAVIRNWLRANVPGFKRLRLTDSDIIQAYIIPARGFVTRSKETGAQSLERAMAAFSRGPAGSQAVKPRTDAFKEWFSGSKVKQVVYHATAKDFDAFNTEMSDLGAHFGTEGQANKIAGGMRLSSQEGTQILPVWLSIKNPLRLKDTGTFHADGIAAQLEKKGLLPKGEGKRIEKEIDANFRLRKQYDPIVRDAIKAAGYDGVVYSNAQEGAGDSYIAFEPTQIKSAIGNNGGFDPDDARINFSRTTDTAKAVGDTLKSITVSNVKQRAGFKLTDYLGIGLQALGRRQIVDIYGDLVPLAEYNRLVQQMEADKNEGGAEADKLVTRWAKLDDEARLADLMHDATLAQIDPDAAYVDGDDKGKFLMLERKFKLLSDEAKTVYRETRDAYKAHHAQVRSAIKERIERSEIKGERKAALLKQMDDEFFAAVKGVYFPLARFGQYVVTVKGPDGKVESVSRAETMAEADALRTSLLDAFPKSQGFSVGRVMLSKEFVASRDAVGRGFMTELYQVLDKQDMDAAQRAELEDTLGQLYLSSLPDLSWAKHGIHRKGTPGFSQDARRAYAQNMFHGARYLAKLRYSDLMQDELTAMQKHVDDWREVEDFDQNSAQRVVDEMNKRHESLMNPKSNALSTALTSLGFVFHLGLSPASAMVNLSQTALVAYPIMGAKWGFGKASAALLKASAEAAKGKNDITASLNEDERAAYDEAVRAGTIDVTMAHDLAGIAQGEDAGVMWKIRPVMRWASFLFHHAERFNRQVTFVAAYRLAREAGADHKAAFEQATKATYDGHFDYGAANRPRIMQGNVAKVLLLFKQYGQNMVYTLARNAYQSIKGTDAEKAEARKVLAGLLTSHAMAAGVLGLPMVTTLLAAASMIGGDDDEPWDAKVALQNMLADTFGQKPAEVLAHGLSRLTPWDISVRVGLDRLIFPDVQEGLEGQRLWESAATQALGPVGGIFGGALKGLDLMSDGHYQLGLEAMLPAVLRQAVKSVRYGMDGAQDKTGVSIKDEVSMPAVVGQLLGFSPSEVRLAQEGKSAVYQQDKALLERRQELLTKAARATMAKDAQARAEAMKEIERFNQKNPARRITPLNVLQSVRNRNRRIDQAEGGVYLPKNRRDAVDAGRFAVSE